MNSDANSNVKTQGKDGEGTPMGIYTNVDSLV